MKKSLNVVSRGICERRCILKSVVATGVGISSIAMPVQWVKPIVRQVVLPAHAATSDSPENPIPGYLLSIDPQFSCESVVPFGDEVFVLMSLVPAPEGVQQMDVTISCDGNNSNLALPIDSAGTANITINANSFCDSVIPNSSSSIFTRLELTASFSGEIASCAWEFETEAQVLVP